MHSCRLGPLHSLLAQIIFIDVIDIRVKLLHSFTVHNKKKHSPPVLVYSARLGTHKTPAPIEMSRNIYSKLFDQNMAFMIVTVVFNGKVRYVVTLDTFFLDGLADFYRTVTPLAVKPLFLQWCLKKN